MLEMLTNLALATSSVTGWTPATYPQEFDIFSFNNAHTHVELSVTGRK
jgi:hypothetical protein